MTDSTNFIPGLAFDSSKFGKTERNVIYRTVDGMALGLDIYYPASGGPWPVYVFVHGGGWTEGDRSDVDSQPVANGYLVVSIDYRMYPAYRFPAMIEDVKCAIRFLRAHAQQYNLDPDRMVVAGHSAGGHLAALAALADESAGWDVGEYLDYSSKVQAAIVISGPSDLQRNFPDEWVKGLLQNVFGPQQLVSGSPVTYARPGLPPVMIIHGDADPVVPVEQAHLLYAALKAANVPVELLIVHNGGHGLEPVGEPVSISYQEVYAQALAFIGRSLAQGRSVLHEN